MDITQLKTFKMVALEGSVTLAASKLHLSPPALSAHIKMLEASLGLTLFDRTATGMSLTREGAKLLANAEQTLNAHAHFLQVAQQIRQKVSGILRIGMASNASSEKLGRFITLITERYPDVQLEVIRDLSAAMITKLTSGQLDVVFYNDHQPPKKNITAIKIHQFGVYLVAAKGLKQPDQPFQWALLNHLPWISPGVDTCCGALAEQLFAEHQFFPKRMIYIGHEEVQSSLISHGLGVGLLHSDEAEAAVQQGKLDILLEVNPSIPVYFACDAKRTRDPLIQLTVEIIEEMARHK